MSILAKPPLFSVLPIIFATLKKGVALQCFGFA